MKIKKHQLFLWIGLAFFVLSCLVITMEIITAYREYVPSDSFFGGFEFVIFFDLVLLTPVIFLELPFIASIYKILKHKPHGAIMTCWLISAILSASAIIFQILTIYGVLDFVGDTGTVKVQESALLVTGWPIIILSSVLSSIHERRPKNKAQISGIETCI